MNAYYNKLNLPSTSSLLSLEEAVLAVRPEHHDLRPSKFFSNSYYSL